MINRRINCKKIFDYVDIRNFEVLLSIFISIVIFFVTVFINMYSNFDVFTDNICDIVLCIIGALIGVLGILLAGVAFIAGLFSPEYIEALTYGLKIAKEKGEKIRGIGGKVYNVKQGKKLWMCL